MRGIENRFSGPPSTPPKQFGLNVSTHFQTVCLLLALVALTATARAAELSQGFELFKAGKYDECTAYCAGALAERPTESWFLLALDALTARGKYQEAEKILQPALKKYPRSIRVRWRGVEVLRRTDGSKAANALLGQIASLINQAAWRYRDPASQMVLAKMLLKAEVDPRQVLDEIYSRVAELDPEFIDVPLAVGELALSKHDYRLAAQHFTRAAKIDEKNADVHFGLARSYEPSDSKRSQAALDQALELNPNHVASLLFIVDHHIDAERYDEAETVLQRVVAVHADQPQAWAYRAVLAHLLNRPEEERAHRTRALSTWSQDPQVDHLIGRKLSQKYRFGEGAAYQRRALALDARYLPAKEQLSQDLLRLGEELEGWKLADEVRNQDNYNIVAHNLVRLRDRLTAYRTLKRDGFHLRMQEREANIYGQRALQLLSQAKAHLCTKYDVEIEEPIYVEIFPRQQDFAIRTFGLPGGAGYLGVCFGRVITMNSPASQGDSPSNWEAVLWHEFCHVVTLQKTENKMPRWLSEGISVYEERERNPSWGQSMTPEYRQMILSDQLTPVSQLSGAFLRPPSPAHLQFAYYESSLVVEYLVQEYGIGTLKRVLDDLAIGMPINDVLTRHTGAVQLLDKEFDAFARAHAKALAPDIDWEEPESTRGMGPRQVAAWLETHPHSFWGLRQHAIALISAGEFDAARAPVNTLIKLFPNYSGADNGYAMLARLEREAGDVKAERTALEQAVRLDADAVTTRLRLMQLCADQEAWQDVLAHGKAALAVNPLIPAPHRYVATAAEKVGAHAQTVGALRAITLMQPLDPAQTHYRLALALHQLERHDEAKREVLKALEEAPRYRAAHRLLREIIKMTGPSEPREVNRRGVPPHPASL